MAYAGNVHRSYSCSMLSSVSASLAKTLKHLDPYRLGSRQWKTGAQIQPIWSQSTRVFCNVRSSMKFGRIWLNNKARSFWRDSATHNVDFFIFFFLVAGTFTTPKFDCGLIEVTWRYGPGWGWQSPIVHWLHSIVAKRDCSIEVKPSWRKETLRRISIHHNRSNEYRVSNFQCHKLCE